MTLEQRAASRHQASLRLQLLEQGVILQELVDGLCRNLTAKRHQAHAVRPPAHPQPPHEPGDDHGHCPQSCATSSSKICSHLSLMSDKPTALALASDESAGNTKPHFVMAHWSPSKSMKPLTYFM